MQKLNIPVSNNYFLDKIATFDFDQFYTKKKNFIPQYYVVAFCHFLLLSYILAYDIPPLHSLILTLRMTICNMAVLYFLLYSFTQNLWRRENKGYRIITS